tara:strand:- start:274 stop:609 length:336 start_codon:yes stop_codon:yes gene_type:complete
MYSSRGRLCQQSASKVTQAARVSHMTVRLCLNIDATLEEVKRSHAALTIKANATALEFAAAGQTLDAKYIEATAVSAVIEGLSSDKCKHIIYLPVGYGFQLVVMRVLCCFA